MHHDVMYLLPYKLVRFLLFLRDSWYEEVYAVKINENDDDVNWHTVDTIFNFN